MELTNTQSTASSDYFEDDDPEFLDALSRTVLPGDIVQTNDAVKGTENFTAEPLPPTQPRRNLKRPHSPDLDKPDGLYQSQNHHKVLASIDDDKEKSGYLNSDVYGASKFGDFGQYMARKRAKLQIQNAELQDTGTSNKIFSGVQIYVCGHRIFPLPKTYGFLSIADQRMDRTFRTGPASTYYQVRWRLSSLLGQEKSCVSISIFCIVITSAELWTLRTHVITCYLTPNKIKEFQYMKVARPEWLTESVKAGVLLPWSDFKYEANERMETQQGKRAPQTSLYNTFITQSSTPRGSALAEVSDIDEASPAKPVGPVDIALTMPPPAIPAELSSRASAPLHTTDPMLQGEVEGAPGYASHKSNPHAERAMANPAWRAAHTSIAPDFIEGYYKNSRLHHLSSWKAELKSLVSEAMDRAENGTGLDIIPDGDDAEAVGKIVQQNMGGKGWMNGGDDVSMKQAQLVMRSPSRKGKEKAEDDSEDRVIMHCDFDSFFVSAGLVDRPHLRGKPVVVCHSQGNQGGLASTSEIASASYEAREFGIKGGMRFVEYSQYVEYF